MSKKRKKKNNEPMIISGKELLMNRSGKVHKGMTEVSRGTGTHTPYWLKKSYKKSWKKDVNLEN